MWPVPRAGLRDTDANQARRNEFLPGTKDGVGLWDKAAVNLSAADRRRRDGTTGTEIFGRTISPQRRNQIREINRGASSITAASAIAFRR